MTYLSKQIPGYPDYYISESGQVYSTKNRKIKMLTNSPNSSGYLYVLIDKKSLRVHRLVAMTYLGMDEHTSLVVNHKDCNKTNNHVSNLEVITYKENAVHARLNNRYHRPCGENNGMSKYNNEFILKLRRMCELGLHDKEVGDILKISSKDVNRIRLRKRWAHI